MPLDQSWIADLLAGYKTIKAGAAAETPRNVLTLKGGFSVADNVTTGETEVTVSGVSGQQGTPVVNGANHDVPTNGQATVRLTGPSAAFSIGGLAPPGGGSWQAGQRVSIINTTTQTCTIIAADASSTATNRIDTLSGGSVTLPRGREGVASFVYDGTTNRLRLEHVGFQYNSVINVRDFGAVGDGVTDDTAAIQAAATLFQASMLVNGYPTYGSQGYQLYFPSGNYVIHSPILITGVTGGVIKGDGITSSVVTNAATAAMSGALGLIILTNCQHLAMRDLDVRPACIPMQFAGSGLAANGTSFTLNFVTNLSPGQRVALVTADGTKAEMVSILTVVGTTITIAQGSLYAYALNDYLVGGPLGSVTCVNDDTGSPRSHANKFERVSFNGPSSRGCLFGFATVCRGGGPVATVGTSNSGQPVATVADATQIVDGETYSFWNGVAAVQDTLIVQSHSAAAGTVTFTTNLTHTYGAGIYLVSASDANNDEHVFHHCIATNAAIAAYGLIGWNSLNHSVFDSEAGGSYAVVSARQGGSIKFIGGDASGLGASYEFGGGQQQPQILQNTESEGGTAQLFVSHSVDNTQGLTIWADHVLTKSHPISGNLIDLTSTSLNVTLHACLLASGLSGGNSIGLKFVDSSASGIVVLHGNNEIGPDALILTGVTLIDHDSTWGSPAVFGQSPTESLSNGGNVRSFAPTYGGRNGSGGGSIERRPSIAVTLANGNNDSVVLTGDADLVVTGPTGAYTLKGFATGNKGQRLRVKFNVNQALTIKNNSSAGVPILTPTGADVVFGAPGAFNILDFWCDGTNWNLV